MNKDRQIILELRNFFTENGCRLGIQRVMNVRGTINITERQMAFERRANCKFTCAKVIQMMILFPFFPMTGLTSTVFAGKALKLFFYRFGRKGEWKALLSTDTSRTPYKTYQIYSMRWSIEVSFHDCKSILRMGKCQCRDFGSQIASISLNMLQYNL